MTDNCVYHLNTFVRLTTKKKLCILSTTLSHASNVHEILILKFPLFGAHSSKTSVFYFEYRVNY